MEQLKKKFHQSKKEFAFLSFGNDICIIYTESLSCLEVEAQKEARSLVLPSGQSMRVIDNGS